VQYLHPTFKPCCLGPAGEALKRSVLLQQRGCWGGLLADSALLGSAFDGTDGALLLR